jgi:hypothetical protein
VSVPYWEWQRGKRPPGWTDADEARWRGDRVAPDLAPTSPPAEGKYRLEVVSFAEFVELDEAGAEPLLGSTDDVVLPENGDGMFYGDGGAGKTTLGIDLAFHLAAGDDWLGIPVTRPVRVLLIENEGPRPLYRAKLRRKGEAWLGSPVENRISVLERPWGKLSLADPCWREALAGAIEAGQVDVVIAGPVSRLGMDEAGTLQEVRDFLALIDEVRERSGRRVAVVLIHHENKGGKVSGAWEGSGDMLLHVTAQGHGHLRLYFQKARWSSTYHATTMQLRWAEGESFEVEEAPELDDATIAEKLLTAIGENPGTGWTRVVEATPGMGDKRRRAVRAGLFREGRIVNIAKDEDGALVALDHCPERKPARLHLGDDPTIAHLRLGSAAAEPQAAADQAAGEQRHLRPAADPKEAAGLAAADSPPIDDDEIERLAEVSLDAQHDAGEQPGES